MLTNDHSREDTLFKKALKLGQANMASEQFGGFASNPLIDEDDNILLED
jgi:hypothetical protein